MRTNFPEVAMRTRKAHDLPREDQIRKLISNPLAVQRELNNRSLYEFIVYFWPEVSSLEFSPNWHIEVICKELEDIAASVASRQPRKFDYIFNVPPGSTKTIICSIMFPAWVWTKYYSLRFICSSYSAPLSMESAEYCRDLIRSQRFQEMYPELEIKEDKDTKSNFKIMKKMGDRNKRILPGGNRYSTSVGGTLTGFHGDILIVDDPLNPEQAASDVELKKANHWVEQTLSTRKTDKAVTVTILIMQRLHQNDPSGHMLAKKKKNLKHYSIPGECRTFREQVKPPALLQYYKDDLMDVKRMPWTVLEDMETDLGQYGYAGQVGQNPTPAGGGMFKVDKFLVVSSRPPSKEILKTVRYWDKAGSVAKGAAYTVGVKISKLTLNRWLIEDVKRGRWDTHTREEMIRRTALSDGTGVDIWIEQEPGSGGKESAEGTIRNLAGFTVKAERPTGDKEKRADPYSVQVNVGAFSILNADWNREFIEEHRFFPNSTFKDQVDASGGAFAKLVGKRNVRIGGRR